MSFRNPYNFVPVDEDNIPRKKDYFGHDIFSGISGSIICRLTSKSNLITAGKNTPQQKIQYKINDDPAIQASSLKGMLRATAEAISNSCLSQMKHTDKVKANARIDSCDVNNGLCSCCRLFGTTAKTIEGQKHPFTFKGKVMLHDAIFEKGVNKFVTKYLKEYQLMGQHIDHRSFYFNSNKIKGRKFYYHQINDKLIDENDLNSSEMLLISKDVDFKFHITFENLTEEEYALLFITLELEEDMCHKIGMGKPIGLGSCKIKIIELKEFHTNRYVSIEGENSWIEYKDQQLTDRIRDVKKKCKNKIPDELKCILNYDTIYTNIRYPDKKSGEFNHNLHEPCMEFV